MYKLIKLPQDSDTVQVTFEFEAITLQEMLETYANFLRASGFCFNGELEIVDNNSDDDANADFGAIVDLALEDDNEK